MSLKLLAEAAGRANPWAWHPHVSVWIAMGAALLLYAEAVRVWGPRYVSPGEPPVTRAQVRFFALGVLALWIGADWPIHDLSEGFLFSVHTLQHMLFTFVAPPLLLLGCPDWLARRLLRPAWVMAFMRRATKPLPAAVAFNGFLVFSHWPAFVDATLRGQLLHFSAHLILVMLAVLMWWPVLSPMPELPRISSPAQMLYLFGQTIVPTVPASFLTFGKSAFYRFYAEAPRLFAGFSAVMDQNVAGLIMKVGGGLLLWGIIAYLFFRWAAREESGSPDTTSWQDLERALNQAEPRR